MHSNKIILRFSKRQRLIALIALSIIAMIFVVVLSVAGFVLQSLRARPATDIVSSTLPLSEKWKFSAEDRIAFPPKVRDGIVFIKTTQSPMSVDTFSKSKLIALDAETGEKLWETIFNGLFKDVGPLIVGDVIVTPINAQRALRGIKNSSGEILWEIEGTDTSDYIHGLAEDSSHIFVASGIDPIRVYAIAPTSGQIIWQQAGMFPVRSLVDILYKNEKVYVLFTTNIFVLNPETGEIIQNIPIGAMSFDRPANNSDLLFTNPQTGIWAINLESGTVAWTFRPECIRRQDEGPIRQGRYFLYSPTPIGDAVYLTGGCRKVFALDERSGTFRWEYDGMGKGTVSHVADIDGIGYILFTDGTIRGIDLQKGVEVGRLVTSPADRTWEVDQQGITSWKKNIYFTFGDNSVFAFGK